MPINIFFAVYQFMKWLGCVFSLISNNLTQFINEEGKQMERGEGTGRLLEG